MRLPFFGLSGKTGLNGFHKANGLSSKIGEVPGFPDSALVKALDLMPLARIKDVKAHVAHVYVDRKPFFVDFEGVHYIDSSMGAILYAIMNAKPRGEVAYLHNLSPATRRMVEFHTQNFSPAIRIYSSFQEAVDAYKESESRTKKKAAI